MSPRCITRGKELLSNRFSLCQRAGAEFGDTAIFIDNGRGPEEKKNISAFFYEYEDKRQFCTSTGSTGFQMTYSKLKMPQICIKQIY